MSLFEFMMVLVSLIVGLGVTELLTGIAKTIRSRDTIQLYWVHALLVITVLLALLQTWWEIWAVRGTPAWTFPGLLMMIGGPIGLFLIAHLIFPDPIQNSDFKSYYYNKMVPLFWIAVITVVISATFRPLILGQTLFNLSNISSFFLVVIFTCMALIRSPKFHSAMVIIIFLSLLADILLVNFEIS